MFKWAFFPFSFTVFQSFYSYIIQFHSQPLIWCLYAVLRTPRGTLPLWLLLLTSFLIFTLPILKPNFIVIFICLFMGFISMGQWTWRHCGHSYGVPHWSPFPEDRCNSWFVSLLEGLPPKGFELQALWHLLRASEATWNPSLLHFLPSQPLGFFSACHNRFCHLQVVNKRVQMLFPSQGIPCHLCTDWPYFLPLILHIL